MGRSCRASCTGLLAMAAAALAACGGGDDTSTAPSTTGAAATSTSAPAPATTATTTTATATTAPAAVTTTSTAPTTSTTTSTAPTSTTSTTVLGAVGPDLKVDQMVDWMHFESLKCGGPIGTWPIVVSGTRDVGGGVTLVLTGAGQTVLAGAPTAANGTFAADWTISVEGVPLTTGGQDAHIDGTAVYDGTTLTVEGRPSGTSHGENPYRSVVLAMLSSVERVALTPVAGTFC